MVAAVSAQNWLSEAEKEREHEVFHKKEYEKLANISASHIYNLRKRPWYLRK